MSPKAAPVDTDPLAAQVAAEEQQHADELAARRAGRDTPDPDEPPTREAIDAAHARNGTSASIETRASDPPAEEDDDGQFVLEIPGAALTLGKLVGKNAPHELRYKMTALSIPGRGGLLHPDQTVQLLVTAEVKHYQPTPQRDSDHKVDRWVTYCVLKPEFAEPYDVMTCTGAMLRAAGVPLAPDTDDVEYRIPRDLYDQLGLKRPA